MFNYELQLNILIMFMGCRQYIGRNKFIIYPSFLLSSPFFLHSSNVHDLQSSRWQQVDNKELRLLISFLPCCTLMVHLFLPGHQSSQSQCWHHGHPPHYLESLGLLHSYLTAHLPWPPPHPMQFIPCMLCFNPRNISDLKHQINALNHPHNKRKTWS